MAMKQAALARRAQSLLRSALLWAQKGQRLMKLLPHRHSSHICHYGEQQLSFGDTPTIRFRMHRPCFSCIRSSVQFEDDDTSNSHINSNIVFYPQDKECYIDSDNEGSESETEDEGIDVQAEEFIERFYEQMKLQCKVSIIQSNDMLHRGMST